MLFSLAGALSSPRGWIAASPAGRSRTPKGAMMAPFVAVCRGGSACAFGVALDGLAQQLDAHAGDHDHAGDQGEAGNHVGIDVHQGAPCIGRCGQGEWGRDPPGRQSATPYSASIHWPMTLSPHRWWAYWVCRQRTWSQLAMPPMPRSVSTPS